MFQDSMGTCRTIWCQRRRLCGTWGAGTLTFWILLSYDLRTYGLFWGSHASKPPHILSIAGALHFSETPRRLAKLLEAHRQ